MVIKDRHVLWFFRLIDSSYLGRLSVNSMLISLLVGLVIAFGGLLVGYGIEGGSVASFMLPSPILIVVGGTIGATITSCGLSDFAGAFKTFAKTLSKKNSPNPEALIKKLSDMTDRCRKEGILVLQTMLNDSDIAADQYLLLKEGMVLILDMKNSDQIQEVLESDIEAFSLKRQMQTGVFEAAGGYSPTMGVIGTVMGLVQVLSNMSDPEHLTSAIAVAFVATLYGVALANLIYLPIASQIKVDTKRQILFKQIIIDGIALVASGESSRNLENKLSLYYQAFPKGDKKYKDGITN